MKEYDEDERYYEDDELLNNDQYEEDEFSDLYRK
jgi:hypothetical protein